MVGMLKRSNRKWSIALFAGIVALFMASALLPALAVLPGSPSSFESGNDPTLGLGNMIPEASTPTNADWSTVQSEDNYVELTDGAASTSDDSFTPGQKQDTTCPDVEGHKNPPKDDFTHVASFFEQNTTTGDVYLYGATIRFAANGNASENIELKQGTTLCPGGSTLIARTAGDKLLAIDYLGGGSAVEFHVLTWVTSGACFVGNNTAPCWGATVATLDPTVAEGGVNGSTITAANNPISNQNLVAGKFAEFGVNLSGAGILPSGSCDGISQTVWESRSSGSSFVSSTKDITIEDKDIALCGSVEVTKVGSDGGSQAGAVFTLYEGGPDPLGDVVGTCTVNGDGDCVNDDGTTTFPPSFDDLQPGTYTIDETTVPDGYGKDTDLPQTFTVAAGQNVQLSYEDPALTGAIQITKTAKHADTSGETSPNLVAGFTITDSDGATHSATTDENGSACVDGLPAGDATVSETDPPTGYSPGPDQIVTVVASTTCADANGVTASFENTPLTDVDITIDSQVEGGTSTTITCFDADGNEVDSVTVSDGSLSLDDLPPQILDCEINIDP